MGGAPGYLGGDHVLGRRGEDDAVGRPFAVEYDARRGRDHAEVQVVGANQAAFFVAGEYNFDCPVAAAVGLICSCQSLEHYGHAGFAVAA